MKRQLLVYVTLLFSTLLCAQEGQRIPIAGKIVVKANDIEGVTVYNRSSEKGTITDFEGNFTIEARLNDRIEFSALQLKKFTVAVDQGIINQGKMTIFMVERVNTLPEVVITPYDLSGNIIVDVSRVKTLNLPFEPENFDLKKTPVDLTPDRKSEVTNAFVRGAGGKADMLGADLRSLGKLLSKAIFGSKTKKTELQEYKSRVGLKLNDPSVLELRTMYDNEYMSRTFDIPESKVNEFIVFAEDNGLDYNLLTENREMEFVEFLVNQSQVFLKLQSEKD